MGADIHLFVEKKNRETGKWEIVEGLNPNIQMYREWANDLEKKGDFEEAKKIRSEANKIEKGEAFKEALVCEQKYRNDHPEDYEDETITPEEECEYYAPMRKEGWLYNGRNYNLFAILADVRNGYGFAGIKTGEGFNPIADPRGVPGDASDYYKRKVIEWDSDGHSHSYHTFAQLRAYDWKNQSTILTGIVDEEQYLRFKQYRSPEYFCADVRGNSIEKVTNEVMDQIISGDKSKETGKSYRTRVEWTESYDEASGHFMDLITPQLEALSEDGKGEDVRIIFFFDN